MEVVIFSVGHSTRPLTAIGDLLDRQARVYVGNDTVVYVERGLPLNYRQYQEMVNRVAKDFLRLGLKKGDHVAIWATNYPE